MNDATTENGYGDPNPENPNIRIPIRGGPFDGMSFSLNNGSIVQDPLVMPVVKGLAKESTLDGLVTDELREKVPSGTLGYNYVYRIEKTPVNGMPLGVFRLSYKLDAIILAVF